MMKIGYYKNLNFGGWVQNFRFVPGAAEAPEREQKKN